MRSYGLHERIEMRRKYKDIYPNRFIEIVMQSIELTYSINWY